MSRHLEKDVAPPMLALKTKPDRSVFMLVTRFVLLALMAFVAIALVLAPKPWEHPQLGKLEDFVRVYSWWAGLINLVPLACLALTTGRWLRPLPARPANGASPRLSKGFCFCVAGAMAACAILGYPRLGQSLWEDEEYSVRRCIVGGHRVQEDGTVVVKRLPWKVTLWNYASTTNHIFQSILSRLSHSAWRTVARPTGTATQRSRHSLAQLLVGHPPRGRDRIAGSALRPGVGGRAGGLAYCHSPVALAICNRGTRLRADCLLNSGQLPVGRSGLE